MRRDASEDTPAGSPARSIATRAPRLTRIMIALGCVLGLSGLGLWVASRLADRSQDVVQLPELRPFPGSLRQPELSEADRARTAELTPKIERLCSSCHLLPTPDVEPRYMWRAKIEQMYNRYIHGARPIPEDRVLPIEDVIEYWSSRAPEYLSLPLDAVAAPPSPLKFARRAVVFDAIPDSPAISCVKLVQLADNHPLQLLISDLRHGVVILWTPTLPSSSAQVIARVPHPSHTTVVDLDQDGLRDILVANMGVFSPVDTDQGSVVWLRNRGDGAFDTIVLQDGLGRVNDVQAADFNADGKLDLIVAVFGNLTTGMLTFMENGTTDWSEPRFDTVVLEHGPGTLDVPLVDLDGDGQLDFVMLQAQERERVVAFLHRGWGSFRQELIYEAPHPRWSSLAIRLADVLGSGRTDILYAHGDSLDNPPIIRPYHGITWLENRGTYPFTPHRLAHFPGAHTAMPIDLDGDGHLDVVGSAFIPAVHPWSADAAMLDSVIWLRQTTPGEFQRYSLETAALFHPCGDVGDINGDGAPDVVLGNFVYFDLKDIEWNLALTIYEQEPGAPSR